MFDREVTSISENVGELWASKDMKWTTPARFYDLIFREATDIRVDLSRRVKECQPIGLIQKPDLAKSRSIYHDMFLSQPPTKEVEIIFYYARKNGTAKYTRFGEGYVHAQVSNDTGVTLRDLLYVFRTVAGRGPLEDPGNEWVIKIQPSVLYMGGVVFPTEEERMMVKTNAI